MFDIRDFYLNQVYNCAETILQATNSEFSLNLDIKTIKIMSGFGGGMFEEDICGVVSGGVASLSLIFPEKEEKHSLLEPAVIEFKKEIINKFKDLNCRLIKPPYRKEDVGCLNVITSAYEILTRIIKKYKEKADN